jgi:ketosteroid isomerase-like protein
MPAFALRFFLLVSIATSGSLLAAESSTDAVLAEVAARDAELAAAHGRGDMAAYRAGLSKDYAYIDIGGQRVDADKLQARRTRDQRRVVSSEGSEEEAVRVSENVVLLRGLERTRSTYYGGLPREGASRWSALWVREADGVWRLAAETATPVRDADAVSFVPVPQPAEVLARRAGRWRLALPTPMELVLEVQEDHLVGRLVGQDVRWTFRPISNAHFMAKENPFELRYTGDDAMELVTWGTPTRAVRID